MAEQRYVYIENREGTLFRGGTPSYPSEFWWAESNSWEPWGGEVPTPQHWGTEITEAEAEKIKAGMKNFEDEKSATTTHVANSEIDTDRDSTKK
jgi:hypothetical protein